MLLLVFLFCLVFQIIRFVISTFMPIFFIEISFVLPPPPDGMQCCRSDWPGLCLFCWINPFNNFLPPSPREKQCTHGRWQKWKLFLGVLMSSSFKPQFGTRPFTRLAEEVGVVWGFSFKKKKKKKKKKQVRRSVMLSLIQPPHLIWAFFLCLFLSLTRMVLMGVKAGFKWERCLG